MPPKCRKCGEHHTGTCVDKMIENNRIGIISKEVWKKKRIIDLLNAINRYVNDDIYNDIVYGWVNEFNQLMLEMKK